jgi:hypothetical protein
VVERHLAPKRKSSKVAKALSLSIARLRWETADRRLGTSENDRLEQRFLDRAALREIAHPQLLRDAHHFATVVTPIADFRQPSSRRLRMPLRRGAWVSAEASAHWP